MSEKMSGALGNLKQVPDRTVWGSSGRKTIQTGKRTI